MMRKLASIRRKLEQPGYRQAFTQERVVAFIRANPHVQIELSGDGPDAAIVHQNDPQHRWALLKLVDDDFLHSSLTDMNYEANSKSVV